ncbi:MAG: cytotoxic translational repressor of toxin-antitoxin stability system [Bdellovibrionaceae bacterium]|nr:cytotoxic translational repressor of toxin-antitoxin stability system [Pseudobdellovibrionaceae bacterium]
MNWVIEYTSKARKQMSKLPLDVADIALTLIMDIEVGGPVRGDWPNFSKLSKTEYHCHLKKGKPTYVVCWRLVDKKNKRIEVYYVGTHEKAPY